MDSFSQLTFVPQTDSVGPDRSMILDDYFERQYNTSFSVADEGTVLADWQARAAQTRRTFPLVPDIAYGPNPREVLDFYRAANAHGALVFIHGGYWRGLSKVETSWVVDGFVNDGISVALINYPLCPEVMIADICRSIQEAFTYLFLNVLNDDERRNVVVAGHSAGGYLAASHLATDWIALGLPQNPLAGVVAISGIYDLAPLIQTSMNADLQITVELAAALNLLTSPVRSHAPLLLAVGGDETPAFHTQATNLAAAWKVLAPKTLSLPDSNHFTVVDSLSHPQGEINKIARRMLSRTF